MGNEQHYTNGTTFQGKLDYGAPPVDPVPTDPAHPCMDWNIDPNNPVWVTAHVKYGHNAPVAGAVPVHDDAHLVVQYTGTIGSTFQVDLSSLLKDHEGYVALTWNIGTGVTSWVRFDCREQEATTTTSTVLSTAPTTLATTTTMPMAVITKHNTPDGKCHEDDPCWECPNHVCTTATTVVSTLPRTGPSEAVPHAGIGVVLVFVGAVVARHFRNKNGR